MSDPRFQPFVRKATRHLLQSDYFSVRVDDIERPDGSEGLHYLIHVPFASVVLPVLEDGRIVLIRQWRHSLGKAHLELPAGRIHGGETPEQAARRELREETGYRAESLVPMPMFHPLMGLSNHEAHPFLARGLSARGAQELEAPEQIVVETYEPEDVRRLILQGVITDVFALVPLMRYLLFGPVREA